VKARNRAWAEELKLLDKIEKERGLSEEEKGEKKGVGYKFGSLFLT
jgi:hypothetical protein